MTEGESHLVERHYLDEGRDAPRVGCTSRYDALPDRVGSRHRRRGSGLEDSHKKTQNRLDTSLSFARMTKDGRGRLTDAAYMNAPSAWNIGVP